ENSSLIKTALGCCGCNTCSYYACHHDLSPAELMMMVKQEFIKQGIKPSGQNDPQPSHNVTAEVPSGRLLYKLGLKDYDRHGIFEDRKIDLSIVYMPLASHIGKKALPIVKIGDTVKEKQKIAAAQTGISANVHSSIDGVVKKITDTEIIIEGR
ncbi:MAG: proton-conducting rane transporter, partial [Clostridia bacterium]|nr:proton-conducting rane transporter [Clostridia bacterium]